MRGWASAVGGLIVAALLPLSVATPVAAAAYCAPDGILDAEQLPTRVARSECDLVGRTIRYASLQATVPPPGQGYSTHALTTAGELSLEVFTTVDGLVGVDAQAEAAQAPAAAALSPGFSAAAVSANDSFASAATLAVPDSFMPTVAQSFDLAEATLEPGEPVAGCAPAATGSLWYRIQRRGSGRRIKLLTDSPAAVYRGTDLSTLERVACIPASNAEQLLTIEATGTYFVQVGVGVTSDQFAFRMWLRNGEMRPDGTAPCDVRTHTLVDGAAARKPLRWRFNGSDTPSPLSTRAALAGLKQGFDVITGSKNDCGLPDDVSARSEYLGRTSKRATLCSQGRADGVNTVSFETAPAGQLGFACSTWTITAGGKRNVLESDMRLTRGAGWTLKPDAPSCRDDNDLVGVVAHEAGHIFGLDHAQGTDGLNQTMAPSASACNGASRTLGRGDVVALRKLY